MTIVAVTFAIRVQKKDRRFSVPAKVTSALGVRSKDQIALSVRAPSGELLFHGIKTLKSGTEIYGAKDIGKRLERGSLILVEASRLSSQKAG